MPEKAFDGSMLIHAPSSPYTPALPGFPGLMLHVSWFRHVFNVCCSCGLLAVKQTVVSHTQQTRAHDTCRNMLYVPPLNPKQTLFKRNSVLTQISKLQLKVAFITNHHSCHMPAQVPLIPAQVPLIPAQVPLIPAQVPLIPAQVPLIPAQVPLIPAQVPLIPAQVPLIPARISFWISGLKPNTPSCAAMTVDMLAFRNCSRGTCEPQHITMRGTGQHILELTDVTAAGLLEPLMPYTGKENIYQGKGVLAGGEGFLWLSLP